MEWSRTAGGMIRQKSEEKGWMHRRRPRLENEQQVHKCSRCKAKLELALAVSHLFQMGEQGWRKWQQEGSRGLWELTMEGFWELLTRHQPSLEEAMVVGAVMQVVGHGPVHSQRGKPKQGQLGRKPLQQLDDRELVFGLWGTRGRVGTEETQRGQWSRSDRSYATDWHRAVRWLVKMNRNEHQNEGLQFHQYTQWPLSYEWRRPTMNTAATTQTTDIFQPSHFKANLI